MLSTDLPNGKKWFTFSGMPLNRINVSILLKEKDAALYWISSASTVEAAVAEMNHYRIGSILVKDGDAVVGIFTERDVLIRIVSAGKDSKTTLVRDVMTKDFQFIRSDTSIEDAMQLMTDRRVRHLPVFEGDTVKGMISIGDVTRWLLKVNEMEAENLRKYVFAEYPG